jgi:hypothetical protein
MNSAQNVTATFTEIPPNEYGLTVSLDGSGSGTVSGSGINCFDGAVADCTHSYVEGTLVTLVATADAGSTFTGWSGGGCSGSGSCEVTMNSAQNVIASFSKQDFLIFLPMIIK